MYLKRCFLYCLLMIKNVSICKEPRWSHWNHEWWNDKCCSEQSILKFERKNISSSFERNKSGPFSRSYDQQCKDWYQGKDQVLGVIIDEHLSFQSHIRYIKGKVACGFGILYQCRPYFNSETMRSLYNCFIYPYCTYCFEVWGNAFQSYLEPLIILQKRAIRMVAGAKKLDHTLPLFHRLNLLQI